MRVGTWGMFWKATGRLILTWATLLTWVNCVCEKEMVACYWKMGRQEKTSTTVDTSLVEAGFESAMCVQGLMPTPSRITRQENAKHTPTHTVLVFAHHALKSPPRHTALFPSPQSSIVVDKCMRRCCTPQL